MTHPLFTCILQAVLSTETILFFLFRQIIRMKIISVSLGFAGFLLGARLGEADATHRNYLRRTQANGPLTLFGPTETGSIKDYGDAKSFCSSKSLVLAFTRDCCNQGTPCGGAKSGEDQWAPVAESDNGWIQLGDSKHNACVNHVAGPPAWGTDGAKNSFEANHVLCKEPGKILRGPAETGSVKDCADAKSFLGLKGPSIGN